MLVPRDRRQDGLVLPMTVAENVTLATLGRNARLGLLSRRRMAESTRAHIAGLDIRPADPDRAVRLLSGGNQQKVVLARWMARQSRICLFDDPTVGVDVGARAEIYRLIARLAEPGAGVVLSSGDPAELAGLCDRVIVMMLGRGAAELARPDLEVDRLVALTTGAAPADPAGGSDTADPAGGSDMADMAGGAGAGPIWGGGESPCPLRRPVRPGGPGLRSICWALPRSSSLRWCWAGSPGRRRISCAPATLRRS